MKIRYPGVLLAILGVSLAPLPALAASRVAGPSSRPGGSPPSRRFALVRVSGRVLGPHDAPVAGAFIQVADGVSSAISGPDGRFELQARLSEGRTLIVTAVGFETARVLVSRAATIVLAPLPTYRPAIIPPPYRRAAADSRVFDTQVAAAYRTRYQSFASNGKGVSGWADNEFGIDARYRAANWVFGLAGFRNKVPFTIAGLSPQPSSAPEIEQSAWSLSAGHVFSVAHLEFLPQLVLSNRYSVPSSSGTPWTGTPLDFSQTRLAGDVAFDVGYRLGPVVAILHGARSFAEATSLSGAPYPATDVGMNEAGIDLGYTIMPGLKVDLSYLRTFDVGVPGTHLDEWADVMGLGLTYLPAQVQP